MKKLFPFFAGFFLFSSISVKAQTLVFGGKLVGGASSESKVTKVINDQSGNIYVIGYYTDSLELDITGAVGGYTLTGGNPGVQYGYVAKYYTVGDIQWGITLSPSVGSSINLKDILVDDGNGRVIVAGSFNGDVEFNPMGTSNLWSSTTGEDGFFATYDIANGMLVSMHPLQNTNFNCSVNGIVMDMWGNLYATGFFDGNLDVNPDTTVSTITSAVSGTDAFIAKYDYNTYAYLYTRVLSGNGNESGDYIAPDGAGGVLVTGHFSNNIDLNWDVPVANFVTNGSDDIFYTHYDMSFNYVSGFNMGGTSYDYPKGLYITPSVNDVVMLSEFRSSMDLDPLGTTMSVTSDGLADIAVSKYAQDGTFINGIRLGNSGPNEAFFITKAPVSIAARSAEGNFYVAFNFDGALDVDPGAATEMISATATSSNTAIVELDANMNKVTYITNEARECRGMCFHPYNINEIVLGGAFNGGIVTDILPYDNVFNVSHTGTFGGYLTNFNECQLTVDVEMPYPYECGTCSATLVAHVQNALAGIYDAYWPTSGTSGLTAVNLCPGTHTVSVTDGHGCTPIVNPAPVNLLSHVPGSELQGIVTPVSTTCNNNLGTASVSVSNAVGTYTLSWSNGDTTAVADSLSAGIYTVNITDSLNCFVTESFSISDSDGPSITVNSTGNPACSNVASGTIDVTISGGAAPLEILWSNGATTEDLTGLTQGTYALVVTDANGCQAQVCISLTSSDPIQIYANSYNTTACITNDGSIVANVIGGTAPYTYLWNDPLAQTTDSASALYAGMYTVTVTDDNGCTASAMFGVSDIYGPTMNWWYNGSPSCYLGTGFIETDFIAWFPPYTVLWSEGSTTDDLYGIEEGGIFLQQITDDNGCKSVFRYDIPQMLPNTPNICMVTVDSTGTQNVIIWDKTTTPEADYYNIYREGFCSSTDFLPIGSVDHDSLSVFYDTVVNTETRSWKYYVTAMDSCGYESLPSEINKTIHLISAFTAAGDVELNWDAYVGRTVDHYEIFRVDPADSTAYLLIDSVSGITLTYLDTDNFTAYDGEEIEYYVEAIPVDPCYASRAFNQNASRSNHTRLSFSAPDTTTLVSGQLSVIEDLVRVYPNPASDRLNISISGSNTVYSAAVMNHVGQVVYRFELNRSAMISTSAWPQGVYYLKLAGNAQRDRVYKIVIAH